MRAILHRKGGSRLSPTGAQASEMQVYQESGTDRPAAEQTDPNPADLNKSAFQKRASALDNEGKSMYFRQSSVRGFAKWTDYPYTTPLCSTIVA